MNSLSKETVKDIIKWDVESWRIALDFWERKIASEKISNALEIGGWNGGLSLWTALKGIPTICSDLEKVEENASPLHQKYGISNLITYQNIDATNIPYQDHFDLIMFKSIIGGIGRNNNIEKQQKVFDQIFKALKPGGILLFAENLQASAFHKKMRKRFVNWGDAWRYVTLEEMNNFLSKFSQKEIHSTGFLATFGRSEIQRKVLAMTDKAFFNHITSPEKKYIA